VLLGLGRCTSAVLEIGGVSPKLTCKKQDGEEVCTAIADALQIPALFGNITTSRDYPV